MPQSENKGELRVVKLLDNITSSKLKQELNIFLPILAISLDITTYLKLEQLIKAFVPKRVTQSRINKYCKLGQ
jgi:hypothetical protein